MAFVKGKGVWAFMSNQQLFWSRGFKESPSLNSVIISSSEHPLPLPPPQKLAQEQLAPYNKIQIGIMSYINKRHLIDCGEFWQWEEQ